MHSGLYLFVGPDRLRKRERISQLAQSLRVEPLDRHDLQAEALSAVELLRLARSHPAVSPVRLIVVDEAQHLDPACVRALREQRGLLAQTACLVLLVDEAPGATHPLDALLAAATVERFEEPAPEPRQAFALIEAIAKREVASALRALHEQLQAGEEPLRLLGLLAWQVQRWLTVARLLDERLSRQRIETLTGLRAWQVDQVTRTLSRWSRAELTRALEACWALDVGLKRGGVALAQAALETLVVELCVERPRAVGARGRAQCAHN